MALVDMLWRDWSPDLDAPEAVAHAKDALRPPGHLRAAISYYRETPTRAPKARTSADLGPPIGWEVQLLYLHGARDGCIGLDSLARIRARLRPTVRVAVLEDAGHFLQLERPAEFNDLILDFLAQYA
jgi:pimeloyl-ACP methyl ester carboxylesterase